LLNDPEWPSKSINLILTNGHEYLVTSRLASI